MQAQVTNLSGPRPRTSLACFTGFLRPYRTYRCALGVLVLVLSPTRTHRMLAGADNFVQPANSTTAHLKHDLVLMQGQLSVRIMRRLVETDFDEEEFLVCLCMPLTYVHMRIGLDEPMSTRRHLSRCRTSPGFQLIIPHCCCHAGVSKGCILHCQRPVCWPGLRHPVAHGVGEASGCFQVTKSTSIHAA